MSPISARSMKPSTAPTPWIRCSRCTIGSASGLPRDVSLDDRELHSQIALELSHRRQRRLRVRRQLDLIEPCLARGTP